MPIRGRPLTVKEWTVVDEALASITVAEPEVIVDPNRFTVADPNRFTVVDPTRFTVSIDPGRFTGDPDKYTHSVSRRFLATGRYRGRGTRKLVRNNIVVLPDHKPQGSMAWLPHLEFMQCLEGTMDQIIWGLGEIVDFTWAAESHFDYVDNPDDAPLYAISIDDEDELLNPNHDPSNDWIESDLWPDVMKLAEELHGQFREDPEGTARGLDLIDLHTLQKWTGRRNLPFHEDVLLAIVDDPHEGLGAAALDYATWVVPGQYDTEWGVAMDKAIEACGEEEMFVRDITVQHFVFHTGSMHQGTRRMPRAPGQSGPELYQLYGRYAINRIRYVADPTFTCVGGHRLLYLEPFGTPVRPSFR